VLHFGLTQARLVRISFGHTLAARLLHDAKILGSYMLLREEPGRQGGSVLELIWFSEILQLRLCLLTLLVYLTQQRVEGSRYG